MACARHTTSRSWACHWQPFTYSSLWSFISSGIYLMNPGRFLRLANARRDLHLGWNAAPGWTSSVLKQQRWSLQVSGLMCSPWAMWGKRGHWTVEALSLSFSLLFYPVTWFLLLLSVRSCRISLFVSVLRLRALVHISKSISRHAAQRTLSLCHDDKFAESPRSQCNLGKWSHRSCGGLRSTNEWVSGCEEFSLHLFYYYDYYYWV